MEKIETFYIIGLAIRTTNENLQSAKDIPLLWQKFFDDNIIQHIPKKLNDNLYCLYTEYEKDFTKPYTTIIGCAVENLDQIPQGLIGKEIHVGNYQKFSVTGNINDGIVINEWNKIWSSNMDRAYTTDFECYAFSTNPQQTQVDIYISI